MAIPKTIYQTFKSSKLPLLTRWHIYIMKKRNPEYDYQFYDDQMIDDFIEKEYGSDIFDLYKRINVGAAKADFFRYAILYKKGGVYLDIDSLLVSKLGKFILPTDCAIISHESHGGFFVQWALVYEAGHPFLQKTLEVVIDNLKNNTYPFDVHKMTGPTAYTQAVIECLNNNNNLNYRLMGSDFEGNFQFSYPMSKLFLYGLNRKNHWKTQASLKPVLKDLSN